MKLSSNLKLPNSHLANLLDVVLYLIYFGQPTHLDTNIHHPALVTYLSLMFILTTSFPKHIADEVHGGLWSFHDQDKLLVNVIPVQEGDSDQLPYRTWSTCSSLHQGHF